MLKNLLPLLLLSVTLSASQRASAVLPSATVIVGQTTLRLGMRRAEVVALLAPKYEVRPNGLVVTRTGPPYEFVATVSFSPDGLLKYVSRDWGPKDQQAGVETMAALYDALTQITEANQTRDGQSINVCRNCSIFVYDSSKSGVSQKYIDIFDGTKTVSVWVLSGVTLPGGEQSAPAVTISESIGNQSN